MARTVFILGAGASAAAGAPLMRDFYRVAKDLQERQDLEDHRALFDLVIKATDSLDPVYAKANMNYTEDLEELFATFEMARVLRRLGDLEQQEIDGLSQAMRAFLTVTIERSVLFPLHQTAMRPHPEYERFAEILSLIQHSSNHGPVAVITFNYDIALEFALYFKSVPFNYALRGETTPENHIPLLKLHGSVNWSECSEPTCGEITPVMIEDWRATQLSPSIPSTLPVTGRPIVMTPLVRRQYHHNKAPNPYAFIVPPTWNKTEYHTKIGNVWQRAAKELSEARNVFIIGYSMRGSDLFFRHLFALASSRGPLIDRLWVINPNADAYRRFQEIAGNKVRPRLSHRAAAFAPSLAVMAAELGI